MTTSPPPTSTLPSPGPPPAAVVVVDTALVVVVDARVVAAEDEPEEDDGVPLWSAMLSSFQPACRRGVGSGNSGRGTGPLIEPRRVADDARRLWGNVPVASEPSRRHAGRGVRAGTVASFDRRARPSRAGACRRSDGECVVAGQVTSDKEFFVGFAAPTAGFRLRWIRLRLGHRGPGLRVSASRGWIR